MPFDDDRTPVLRALERWAAGDLEGTLEAFSEDILFLINVDSHAVPFLASSLGKEDLRQRLQFIKATFFEERFEPESIIHEADYTRVLVNVEFRHRVTASILACGYGCATGWTAASSSARRSTSTNNMSRLFSALYCTWRTPPATSEARPAAVVLARPSVGLTFTAGDIVND